MAPVEAMARGRRDHVVRLHQWRDLAGRTVSRGTASFASKQPAVGGKPLFGYLAAVLLIGASALSIPALVSGFSRASRAAAGRFFGVEALLAHAALPGSLRRTAVLVGALSTAIAMLSAVGIMVGSFRADGPLWMKDRLQADLYIRRPAGPAGADRTRRWHRIAPRVPAQRGSLRRDTFRGLRDHLLRRAGHPRGRRRRHRAAVWKAALSFGRGTRGLLRKLPGEDVLLSASRSPTSTASIPARHIELTTRRAERGFEVLDVYNDYSSERGYIIMDRKTLLRYLPDPGALNIAVYLSPGRDVRRGQRRAVRPACGPQSLILTNRTLREEAIRTFDRTFAITYALEAVAIFVAVMGVAGALLALVIDRRREFGLLRFLGRRSRSCGGSFCSRLVSRSAGQRCRIYCRSALVAAIDLCHQQAVFWLDDSVSLADRGTPWVAFARVCGNCDFGPLSGPRSDAAESDRSDP